MDKNIKNSLVLFSLSEGIATITLNRPEKLNALSLELVKNLMAAFRQLQPEIKKNRCRVLLLNSSSEKAFCAGADLGERIKMSAKQVQQTLKTQHQLTTTLANIAVPTIAVIGGAAFGGGLELALCCDLRIAGQGAVMGLIETKLAIIPGAGGTQRLTRLVGPGRAKELIFMGKRLSASEAERIGLVNLLCDDPNLEAHQWANEISNNGPVAVRAAKLAIDGGIDLSLKAALAWERKCYLKTLKTQDRLEGLKSFSEKRVPRYEGN